jgi:hypothetical protein
MRFIIVPQVHPRNSSYRANKALVTKSVNVGGVFCVLAHDFDDEVFKSGCRANGYQSQGRASQRSVDYLHSLCSDGDPYSSQKNRKTGDRYCGQWNVEYAATNNIPPAQLCKGKVTIGHLAYAERRIEDNGRHWRKDENLL